MTRKLPILAAGIAGFALLVGSTGIAAAAEDDTFSPLNRDPASSRIPPPTHANPSVISGESQQAPLDTPGAVPVESSVIPDMGGSGPTASGSFIPSPTEETAPTTP